MRESALFAALGGLAVAVAAFRLSARKASLIKSAPEKSTVRTPVRDKDIATVLRAVVERGLLSDRAWAMFVDIDALHRHIHSLRTAFPPHFVHCFAVKANPVRQILKCMVDMHGMGLECASLSEVIHSVRVGCPPNMVMFDSPCKTVGDIRRALRLGVVINCDSLEELSRVAAVWEELQAAGFTPQSEVGIRINPLLGSGSIAALSVSTDDSKFAIPLTPKNREHIIAAFARYNWLCALHAHVGSQGCGLTMLASGAAALVTLADEIDSALGAPVGRINRVSTLDIGGGLPANFESDVVSPTFADYLHALQKVCPALLSNTSRRVVTEFGRATIAKLAWTVGAPETCVAPRARTTRCFVHITRCFVGQPSRVRQADPKKRRGRAAQTHRRGPFRIRFFLAHLLLSR